MNQGDVILTPVPQADGNIKNRPAILSEKCRLIEMCLCVA